MRRTQGFSLVELVVVILLIGILSAVAVPRLFSSTDKAHRAAIQNLQAQMSSTLNVIAGEWLLNGSQNPYVIDGLSYSMSPYGYPDVTALDSSPPQQVSVAPARSSDACRYFLVRVIGMPEGFVGVQSEETADASTTDPNAGKTWVAEYRAGVQTQVKGTISMSPDTCIYHYNAGLLGAEISYNPNDKFAIKTVMPQ